MISRRNYSPLLILSVLMLVLGADGSPGYAEGTVPIDYERDVAPILATHCLECHGEAEPEGGLRLTSRENVLLLGDSGEPSIVPGKSGESELLRRVTAGADERMPPEGDPLTPEQIGILTRWIDEGVQWPASNSGPQHWSYIKPQRPALPSVRRADWPQNEIDAFVLAGMESQNPPLSPSDRVEPAKLLRRVHLDLIGLPPTIDQLDRFLADPSREHYERIVDELLKSPRYGEKWARPWLDLARYADSNGFQADQFRSMWAYRDWVISAMNDDMPFDQFTIEQIAGDLLPNATLEQQIATGFQRCTTCNVEAGVDPEENRVNQIIDRVNTFGTVWLGTTLECAQCHNHKYDPFSQQDYYQLFAFFNNTPLEVVLPGGKGVSYEVDGPKLELPLEESEEAALARLQTQRRTIQKQIAARRSELSDEAPAWETKLQESLDQQPTWHDTKITSFISEGGATFNRLEDRSLLIAGPKPDKDTYTVTIQTDLTGITGLKIEMLADDSLPQNGPGRAGPRPNSIINELDLTAASPPEATPQAVTLHSAAAGFSQKNWDVEGAIDGDPKSGWAINPKFGEDHWATFLTTLPIGDAGGTLLTLRIHQNYGGARTIGRLRLSLMTGQPGASLPDDVRQILALASSDRTDEQSQRLQAYHEESDPQLGELQQQMTDLTAEIRKIQPETTLVMVEMAEPRETMIFKRGNFLEPLAEVAATTPAALHPFAEVAESQNNPGSTSMHNRFALAEWVVSTENPLIGRVTVNRWWGEFFGQGLVTTPEDFGTQGEPPSHPDLLDWLAVEFMESGWSMKHMHRLIVTSATYQQDSRVTDELLRRDPTNVLLTRGPRFRLPAETIRDNALAISGLLSDRMGGPPVYPPQPPKIWRHVGRNAPPYATDEDEDRFRRGLYVVWRRSAPYPSFVNFDAPDRGACVVNRSRTNTPLQALTLLNDPAYVEMARALAERLESDHADMTDRERVEYGLRLCTSRQPTSDEVLTLSRLFETKLAEFRENLTAARPLVADDADPADVPRLGAWFFVANVLLNLDETVTKD